MPSRCILILLDGLGDRSYASLDDRTPLQAARTPNLDRLAALGANGLFHAAGLGEALPSENAHFAMFGYGQDEFPGRGYLEALGAGIKLAPEDVAVLAHFDSVREENGTLILEKERPPAEPDELEALVGAIESHEASGVRLSYIQTHGIEGILTLRGGVSPFFTDSDPISEGLALIEPEPWKSHEDDPAARVTAGTVREYLLWCYRTLESHAVNAARRKAGQVPVNAVVTQRPGRFKRVEPFNRRWGLRPLSLASGLVYLGLCEFLGFDIVKAGGGDPGEELAARLELALSRSAEYDFIHVHTKAPDEASHRKAPEIKKEVIESLDRGLGEVADRLLGDPGLLTIVTSDHSSPCTYPLVHSGEPVPITIVGEGRRRDRVEHFNEIDCAGGALGCVRGGDFMYLVLNALDRIKLRGLMDTPVDQPFWHGGSRPLRTE